VALLLFDIDGTLIDGKGTGRRAANRAFKEFFNIDGAFDNMPMMGRTDEYLWRKACKMKGIPIQEYEQKKQLLLKKYYNYLEEELAGCKDAHLHIGVKELIEESAKKHNLGLLTGNFEKSAKIKVKHFGIDKYFPVGAFADDSEDRNKLPVFAIKRAENFYKKKFNNDEIYIIGDTQFDIECAKKNGLISVAVATGGMSYETLRKWHPDYLFESFAKLDKFLEVIG